MTNKNPIQYIQRVCTSLTVLFIVAATLGQNALAQESRPEMKTSLAASAQPLAATPAASANPVPQNVMNALSRLPETDTLLYMNLHRIGTEAAARVLPEKELADLREYLGEIKIVAGVDPTNLDFLVLQVRFKKPDANLNFALPEFMAVASGDFSAEALIQLAKEATKGKLREEQYSSKTLELFTIDEVAKEAEKTPMLKSLSEIAIVALDGNTIAIGTPAYLRAAIDAAGGKGRISPELLNSVMRDPLALVSVAGSPWTAFAKTFALLGTENNPRAPRCDQKLGDFYAAITMDATSFKFRGAMNADNPDTAKIFKSLLATMLQQATNLTKDKNAQTVLSSLVITPTDTEVLVQADVSQQAVADFIRDQSKPKKPEATTTTSTPTKRRPKHRRRHPPAPPTPAKTPTKSGN